MANDGLNVVPVLKGHLAELERVLGFVEGLLVSLDLQAEYQKMGTLSQPSHLTRAVQTAQARVQGYLQEQHEPTPE
jgi:cell division protein ZapA (FtsZ GTPase activity inhibitor)